MPKYKKAKRLAIKKLQDAAHARCKKKDPEEENKVATSLESQKDDTSTQRCDTNYSGLTEVPVEVDEAMQQVDPCNNFEELHVVSETVDAEPITVGRRIVAVSHFFSKLQEISDHGPLGCNITHLKLLSEVKNGLESKFTFTCSLCNLKFVINSDNCDENYPSINKCAVAGAVASGCGHSQLQELFAALNLPLMSHKCYKENHDLISRQWESVLLTSMKLAAEEERKLAIEENRYNKDGIPIIDVVADGCWFKRSYKKNYNALSGAAAIIGKRTSRILFLGIKNKYCSVCAYTEKNMTGPRDHKCFKNFSGPSTNMESEIIVEGFKESINMHNLIYGKLISDGDSSTYSKILEARPYPDVTVEKIECRNHILRNLCNKIQMLITESRYNIKFRKVINKKRIITLRSTICKAIKQHKTGSDIQLLFEDIMLSHLHSFGDHTKCRPYFCNKIGSNEELPEGFFTSSLWQRICFIIQHVAGHVRSLIFDVDSNCAEGYNSIIAKYVGGKRIHFSKRNSYQTRCQAAAVAYNEEKSISLLYKSLNKGDSPQGKLKVLEEMRLNKNLYNMKVRKPKKRSILTTTTKQDRNYGQDCVKPDMPTQEFEALQLIFLENLKKSDKERKEIERKTILQSESSEWLELRRMLLTASNFGKVIKRRRDTSCQSFVKALLYKRSMDHVASIKHGKEKEKVAIKQLEKQEGIRIEPCGLYIDETVPYLGATPDGICGEDMIIEIKCPLLSRKVPV